LAVVGHPCELMSLSQSGIQPHPSLGGLDVNLALPTPSSDLMTDTELRQEKPHNSGLAAHEDARALVRLIQCPQCSKPYRTPVTLPCGLSVCRECLPQSYARENVTYPGLPGRRQAIQCPIESCAAEHTMPDCCLDVTLTKVMEAIAEVVATKQSLADLSQNVEEFVKATDTVAVQEASEKPTARVHARGRLIATYLLAASGNLAYNAEVMYEAQSSTGFDDQYTDEAVLAQLIETTHKELDCQVCYNLMLDPVTTACGHTFCRKCLVRTLDHSLHCPACRRAVVIPPSLHSHPSNKTLVNLLSGLCPDMIAARAEAVATDESLGAGELDTPLFIVALGFPGCVTFLRIFEPRYRLMLRRALDGNRHFGMVGYNRFGAPQGDLGPTQFKEYGTLLRIEHVQFMPDGTSIVELKGISRFKVKAHGQLDGYIVASVERVEDVPLEEEERLEVEDTMLSEGPEGDLESALNRMTTRALLMMGLEFIIRMQARSAPWLGENILQTYGGPPDDAAIFPYWFASILPIDEELKYKLLQTTSVRQRLKITATWIKRMEATTWYRNQACTVL